MGHDGHRARLREKAVHGATEPHEMLELLLFSVLPRVNTNAIAHELIDRFGGLEGVFSADIDSLTEVNGIGRSAAIQIRNTAALIRNYQLSLCHTRELLSSEIERCKYLCALFACSCKEITYMLMFSERGAYLGYKAIGEGTYTQNIVLLRQAIAYARKHGAASVIIAHNHSDGIPIASSSDTEAAKRLNIGFGNASITVRSHYVVADGRCIVFSEGTNRTL